MLVLQKIIYRNTEQNIDDIKKDKTELTICSLELGRGFTSTKYEVENVQLKECRTSRMINIFCDSNNKVSKKSVIFIVSTHSL